MDDDLRKLKLLRDKDPNELLADMAAIEVQFKCNMTEREKALVVLQAGRNDYSVIVTITRSMVKASLSRPATVAKLAAEMHKQYRIVVQKTDKKIKKGADDNNKVALVKVE